MSDVLQSVQEFGLRERPVDQQQAEYRELKLQRANIDRRLKELAEQMQTGVCAECGAKFSRVRLTKIFCTNRCNMRYSYRHRDNRAVNYDLIAKRLPQIRLGRLLSERGLLLVQAVVTGAETREQAAEKHGISRQRILQVLIRAQKAAQLIENVLSVESER